MRQQQCTITYFGGNEAANQKTCGIAVVLLRQGAHIQSSFRGAPVQETQGQAGSMCLRTQPECVLGMPYAVLEQAPVVQPP